MSAAPLRNALEHLDGVKQTGPSQWQAHDDAPVPLPVSLLIDAREAAAISPALLRLADVARFLGISRRQVHRLLAAGRLPPADVNLGFGARGRRWNRERLLAWVAAGCPPADAWEARQRQ